MQIQTVTGPVGPVSFVDPCPIELGRDAARMAEIAARAGANVTCTLDFYFEAIGLLVYRRAWTEEEIAELYVREITHGIGSSGVKAGAIKVTTGAPVISPSEHKFLDATCIARRAVGAPIITHTQDALAGPDQQAAFAGGGVSTHRCLIGHCGWLGKFARQLSPQEQAQIDAQRAAGTWPPPYTYLFTDFVPMLKERGLSETEVAAILEDNPRRFFAGEPLPLPNA